MIILTQAEHQRRLEAYNQGLPDTQAAKLLGLKTKTYMSWRSKQGLPCIKVIREPKPRKKSDTAQLRADFYANLPKRELVRAGLLLQLLKRAKKKAGKLDCETLGEILTAINQGKFKEVI